jgi:hypothetical protein
MLCSKHLSALALLAVVVSPWSMQAHANVGAPAPSKSAERARPNDRGDQHHGMTSGSWVKDYCEGTGSTNGGVDCPCGNGVPQGLMEGCANRTGHGGALSHTGTPSISNDDFVLNATGLPNGVPGFFLAGAGTSGGNVFGNGIRCITGPYIRLTKIVHSSGLDTFPGPGMPPISVQMNLNVGDITYFQVVYRDFGGPCGSSINATNAVMALWGT